MKISIKFILLISIILSCSVKDKKNKIVQFTPVEELIQFPLDSETPNISNGLHYFDAGTPLLFSLNWTKNSILIFDIEKEKLIKELVYDHEGPEGVLDIFGIHVHNLDSIFLFNQLIGQITLIDTSGTIKNKIKYEVPEMYSPAAIQNNYFLSQPIVLKDRIIVKTRYYGDIWQMTNEELHQQELVYAINLTTGKTQFLGIKFPENYLNNGQKIYEHSIARKDGMFVISYYGDHRVFYSEGLDKELKYKEVKSNYIPPIIPNLPDPSEEDGLKARRFLYESPHYETIVYEKYRDLFLRFAMHGFELDHEIPKPEMRNHSGPFSIQLFDSDLNLIHEQKFEANQYNPFDFFIGKKGLYMSVNHPLSPKNNEDFLSFQLFEYN